MVDAVNGISHKNRNAVIGAGVGLVGAGAAKLFCCLLQIKMKKNILTFQNC